MSSTSAPKSTVCFCNVSWPDSAWDSSRSARIVCESRSCDVVDGGDGASGDHPTKQGRAEDHYGHEEKVVPGKFTDNGVAFAEGTADCNIELPVREVIDEDAGADEVWCAVLPVLDFP